MVCSFSNHGDFQIPYSLCGVSNIPGMMDSRGRGVETFEFRSGVVAVALAVPRFTVVFGTLGNR